MPTTTPQYGPLKSYLARHAACLVRAIDFTASFRCRVFKIACSDSPLIPTIHPLQPFFLLLPRHYCHRSRRIFVSSSVILLFNLFHSYSFFTANELPIKTSFRSFSSPASSLPHASPTLCLVVLPRRYAFFRRLFVASFLISRHPFCKYTRTWLPYMQASSLQPTLNGTPLP